MSSTAVDPLARAGRSSAGPARSSGSPCSPPMGTYAANTRPQGGADPANYGQRPRWRHPVAGTWTAVLYTPADRRLHRQRVCCRHPVLPRSSSRHGDARSRFHACAGQPADRPRRRPDARPRAVTGSTPCRSPAPAGTRPPYRSIAAGAIVPVSRRGAFTGTITGGNARAFSPAQTFTYAFDVPKGKRDLVVNAARCPATRGICSRACSIDPERGDPVGEQQPAGRQGQVAGPCTLTPWRRRPRAGGGSWSSCRTRSRAMSSPEHVHRDGRASTRSRSSAPSLPGAADQGPRP